MNIIVIGSDRFTDHLRKSCKKNWNEDDNVIVYAAEKNADSERTVGMVRFYDLVIIEISGNVRKDNRLKQVVSGIIEMNPNLVIICIFSCDLIDVSMFEMMDLSRIIIMKCSRDDYNDTQKISVLRDTVEMKVNNCEPIFFARNKSSQQYIPGKMIICAMKVRSGLKLVTVKGEFFYKKKMDEFEKEIGKTGFFCRCHSSYIVNFKYVSEIQNNIIYLRSGETVPISRNYRSRVRAFVSGDFSAEDEKKN